MKNKNNKEYKEMLLVSLHLESRGGGGVVEVNFIVYLEGKRVFGSDVEAECRFVVDELKLYGYTDVYYAEELMGNPYGDCNSIPEETPSEMNESHRSMGF